MSYSFKKCSKLFKKSETWIPTLADRHINICLRLNAVV